jgi:hypothetical protein
MDNHSHLIVDRAQEFSNKLFKYSIPLTGLLLTIVLNGIIETLDYSYLFSCFA